MARAQAKSNLSGSPQPGASWCRHALFSALISYSPGDVPSWFPLSSHAGARGPVLNFIGRTGAIIACCSYAFLGAASYLVTALLLGYGGAKLLDPEMRAGWRGWWSIGFVFSGAALLHLLPWAVLNTDRLNIAGQGGWVGKWVGEFIFRNTLGIVGSVLVLLLLYVVSLIYLTGIHPIHVARQLMAYSAHVAGQYFAWRMARADEQGRLEIEAERVDKARKRLEKTLTKRGVARPPSHHRQSP